MWLKYIFLKRKHVNPVVLDEFLEFKMKQTCWSRLLDLLNTLKKQSNISKLTEWLLKVFKWGIGITVIITAKSI